MQARDVMTKPVIWITPKAKLGEAIDLMLKSRLSGLPVVDAGGQLVGMLSEGDLLRRAELGTARQRPRWIETFLIPGRSAADYVQNSWPAGRGGHDTGSHLRRCRHIPR